jgi:hypothetical protein
MTRLIIPSLLLSIACSGNTTVESSPVLASLEDGQVLQGLVTTTDVQLRTEFGTLAVPIGDIGELEPVEGGHLEDSHNHVKIWLRNGSELVGEWAEPELKFHLDVGEQWIEVDLPMNEMERFQLKDGQNWPNQNTFAVTTSYGDDFVVDTQTTQFTLTNPLGSFSPYLKECKSLAPIGEPDGDWRVELHNGSILIGKIDESHITFALPMGPEFIRVPLEHIAKLERNTWNTYEINEGDMNDQHKPSNGWFDNSGYRKSKEKSRKSKERFRTINLTGS